jgi:hypothetical protein
MLARDTNARLETVQNHLGVANNRIAVITPRYVPPETHKNKQEVFALYRNADSEYKAVRCQLRALSSSAEKCIRAGYTVLAYSTATVWGGYFISLTAPSTEADLLAFIHSVDIQRANA